MHEEFIIYVNLKMKMRNYEEGAVLYLCVYEKTSNFMLDPNYM